jgi:hypothetical protein
MKTIIKITLLLFIAFVSGCYYDSEERLYPNISNPCDDTVVTFSGTVTQILQPCLSCHSNSNAASAGSGIKLQDYNDLRTSALNGKLMGSINHTSAFPMPKTGGSLPACQIAQLQKWIDNQTPNN